MKEYHDREWGSPSHEDRTHFEFLILEAAQAGLSWLTVLKKREGYRKLFAGFDCRKVSKFGKAHVEKFMKDPSIIRNRLKIESAIENSRRFMDVQKEFGSFDAYLWSFTEGKPVRNRVRHYKELPPRTDLSDRISKDLKKRGFRFVGSTVIYSHLQAVGLVDDHEDGCFRKGKARRT